MKTQHYKSLVAAAILASFTQVALADTIGPLEAAQDTWTNGSNAGSGSNYGTTTTFRIDTGKMRAFVEFDVTIPDGHIIETATLTLTAQGIKAGTYEIANTIPDTFIAAITGVPWNETTLTDLNDDDLLAAAGPTITSLTDIVVGTPVDFDVTSGITGNGLHTFLVNIAHADARAVKYHSSDAGDEALRPKLTIVTKDAGPADEEAPVFDDIPTIAIDATGTLTELSSLVNVTANDNVDGVINATITAVDGDTEASTNVISGEHIITMTATDTSDNSASKDVTVHIKPMILSLAADQQVASGSVIPVSVELSGPAVTYPVNVYYSLIGDAATPASDTLVFNDANPQTIDVNILADAAGASSATLTIDSADNAQLPEDASVMLTVISGNVAPDVELTFSQDGKVLSTIDSTSSQIVSYIDANAGLVTVTATVTDLNEDANTVAFSGSDSAFNASGNTLEIDPVLLMGAYSLTVDATETDTDPALSGSLEVEFVVAAELPELSADLDTDKDTIADSEEGYIDSDGDGIVDYLDDEPDTTLLPVADDKYALQVTEGQLSVGSIGRAANGLLTDSALISSAALTEFAVDINGLPVSNTVDDGYAAIAGAEMINFRVSGLDDGGVATVVYKLADEVVITDKTEYRKYTPSKGWQPFESDFDNSISSAPKDIEGNCPAPLSEAYEDNLTAGNCIQLSILDGGDYDADGETNGEVEDPGLLAEFNNSPAFASIALAQFNAGESFSLSLADLVSDADGDELTISIVSGPGWLSINEDNELNGTPSNDSATDALVLGVTDTKGASAQVSLAIAINKAPVFANSTIVLAPASRNVEYSASISDQVTDADGDSFTFAKVNGPHWLKLSADGKLSGTPLKADVTTPLSTDITSQNEPINVTITATDANGAVSTATLEVTVEDSDVRANDAGSFSAALFAMLGLVSLRRRKQK
ncbi:putative Ig domain-containing protein [Thalassotalea fonticola]|uniref:Ig domain-containing protein n=1 Tax=Thalassotalea fonticola TaxID=3065649 RepID=A0ABZ0GUK1_9GAMM|nr:putative Ig domain-containing protein [Colwelliaceae bacterium S1-1]